MSFHQYHYKRIMGFLEALNKTLPEAIVVNECSSLINEIAIEEKEHPEVMALLYAIIETVCKIDYVTHHNKSEYIKHPLLFVSREDIEMSLLLIKFLE
jgi:hypothetical protein